MSLRSQNFPYAYYQGKVICFGSSKKTRASYFGGPGEYGISGIEHGPYPLHHVLTIWKRDLGVGNYQTGAEIPFYYGIAFEGCVLEYKYAGFRALNITKLDPTSSSEGWPYPFYPPLLRYVPLEVVESRPCDVAEFSESVMQGIKNVDDNEVIVIVPPNPELGMSIWGPNGDQEGVQIIFRHNTSTLTTHAYNACT